MQNVPPQYNVSAMDSSFKVMQSTPTSHQLSFASTPPQKGHLMQNNVPPLLGPCVDWPEVVLVDRSVDSSLGSASDFLSGAVSFDRFRHLCQAITIWVSPGALDLLCTEGSPSEDLVRVIDIGRMCPSGKGPSIFRGTLGTKRDGHDSEKNISTSQRQYEQRNRSPRLDRRQQWQSQHKPGWRASGSPQPREFCSMPDNSPGVDKVRIEDILRSGSPRLRTCCQADESLDVQDSEQNALRNAIIARRYSREPLSARPRGGRQDPPVSVVAAQRFQQKSPGLTDSRRSPSQRAVSESPSRNISAPGQELLTGKEDGMQSLDSSIRQVDAREEGSQPRSSMRQEGLQSLDSSTKRIEARDEGVQPLESSTRKMQHSSVDYLMGQKRRSSVQRLTSAPEGPSKETFTSASIRAPSPLSSYSFIGQGVTSAAQIATLGAVPPGSTAPAWTEAPTGRLAPQDGAMIPMHHQHMQQVQGPPNQGVGRQSVHHLHPQQTQLQQGMPQRRTSLPHFSQASPNAASRSVSPSPTPPPNFGGPAGMSSAMPSMPAMHMQLSAPPPLGKQFGRV